MKECLIASIERLGCGSGHSTVAERTPLDHEVAELIPAALGVRFLPYISFYVGPSRRCIYDFDEQAKTIFKK